ncbi:alpha/beta-hydrolase [Pyrenochaeta sp. DS3sAY3a]|nr:alpha/beta-hydrolase [Pyrenochaeta sp. DS3sAY3a]
MRQELAEWKSVETRDVNLNEKLRARVYIPPRSSLSTTSLISENIPIGLYIHSGGWFTGSIDAEDFLCRDIAFHSRIILISPEYRLAPENPFPAGLEDCFEAYEFIHARAADFGGNPRQKFIMGGSAGGNLTACVALKYASNPELRPSGVMVSCMTSCDPSALPAEYLGRYSPEKYQDTPVIDRQSVQVAREWLQPPAPDHPLYSPLLHPDIKLLPQIYVTAMTNDPSYQETVFFYEECKKQGVKADYVEWSGFPHFFWIVPTLEKSREYMTTWNDKLRAMILNKD